jgi:hypothetical protein
VYQSSRIHSKCMLIVALVAAADKVVQEVVVAG